jgi:hypothetical protein
MSNDNRQSPGPFAHLASLARSVASGEVPRAIEIRGEQRAAESFAHSQRPTPAHRWVGLFAILAAGVASIIVGGLQILQNQISWTVDGERMTEASPYVNPIGKDAVLKFSEGSEVTVQRGSRLRIADKGRKAVHAMLEVGAARVRIAERSPLEWSVDAGPFSVVPGAVASFMVEWLAGELLRVSIFEGDASVTGTPSPLTLHGGQQVSANARDGTVEVRPLERARAATTPTPDRDGAHDRIDVPVEPASSSPISDVAPSTLPSAATPKRQQSWSEAVVAGDYAAVLRDAERRGMAATLLDVPLVDLVALADASRLSGRIEVCKRALLAERSRFARSTAAHDAAFFLGRIADDNERAPAIALPWYETYLREAPRGHFAAEAWGRKMVAISRQSGAVSARETAVEYLKRFPHGPHAELARELANE